MQIVRLISQDHMNNKLVFFGSVKLSLLYFIYIYIYIYIIQSRCLSLSFPDYSELLYYFRQYVGRADFQVFWAMNQHGFLGQL
ncbi:hypothetical protein RchiOBHm_Chr5g0075601 [Rosa chinensis]|uniref:Uncharacterized protein n=1 Tax=Rosa chinensis TaxID=74649 RepID=A0A2P6QLI2_ROSCH|nr:hypothetical protein RchiOBHm_Chr5g0075601 [Rosa chinensis]